MKFKYPLKIIKGEQEENRFKATTSIDMLKEESRKVRRDLSYLEIDYCILIGNIKNTLLKLSENKKIDPRLYWLVGENIVNFLERIDDIGFYLMHQNSTIARDVEISESSIKKIISFRRRFLKLSMINLSVPWKKYRDNKVPVSSTAE
jgi:hypothetical protein